MAARQTIQIGHSSFKSEHLKQLIQDLKDTMFEAGLIGIAAPQIAENYKVFVTEPRETDARPADQADTFRVYINPTIVEQSEETSIIYEGCGSVVNGLLFGPVERPKTITIEALDENGHKFKFKADGILGRVIQHEYDHLQGVEFTEKVADYKKLIHKDFYVKNIRTSPEQINASIITIKEYQTL